MKTSLRNEVINRLPFDTKKGTGIYRRPMEGSGICLKGGLGESINIGVSETQRLNGKVVANSQEFRHSEYENPNVNMLLAFEPVETLDNYYQARRLLLTFNHPQRRDYSKLGEFRIEYYRTLEKCNLCYNCDKPIKVRKARIEEDSRKPHDPFFAEEVSITKLEKEELVGARRIRSVAGKPLKGNRFKPYSKGTNTTYGDIVSHFEYRPFKTSVDAAMKYRLVYVDGTNRRIELRKNPRTKSTYFVEVLKDGSETKIIPQKTYRITNRACKCKRGK